MTRSKVVLIVDDDEDDRILFREAVQEIDRHIRCISVNNGEEALLLLEEPEVTLPDLIFLDLNMPKMDGKQCLIEIKKRPLLLHIPVIIYSTACRLEDEEETRIMGAVHFLTKPVLFNDICSALNRAMRQNWG